MPQIANAGTRPVSAASNSETLQRRAMCFIGLHFEQKGNLACIASICLRHPRIAVFLSGSCGRTEPAASPNLLPSMMPSPSNSNGVRRRPRNHRSSSASRGPWRGSLSEFETISWFEDRFRCPGTIAAPQGPEVVAVQIDHPEVCRTSYGSRVTLST